MYHQSIPKQKRDSNHSLQHSLKENFNRLDTDVSMLSQKIVKQTHSLLISPRTSIIQTNSKSVKDKMRRKINQLNNDCFTQRNLFHFINKPVANLNRSILSFSDVKQSFQLNSPTKLGFHYKIGSYDINNYQDNAIVIKNKEKKENKVINNEQKTNQFLCSFTNNKLSSHTKPLTNNEIKRSKDHKSLIAYKNFNTEANNNLLLNKKYKL